MAALLPDGNPQLPDHINNRDQHPLQDFLLLAAGLLTVLISITLLLAWSTHWLGPRIPYAWEQRWFGAPAAQTDAGPQQQALQQLLEQLLRSSEAPALPVTVHWLGTEDTPNAFATLGGHIVVTGGLLQQVSSENALAMVLAHEYAHIEQRHPAILLLEQLSFMLLAVVLGSDAASTVGQHTGVLTLLSFSREMERNADTRALQMLQQHYGHTHGAAEFFERMQAGRDEATWTAVFQTHPLTQERIEQIQASMITAEPLRPLPEALQAGHKKRGG